MGTAIAAGILGTTLTTTAAGAATAGFGTYLLGAVINLGISALLGKVLAPSAPKSAIDRGIKNVVRNPVVPRRVIYGEAVTGGPYIYLGTGETNVNSETNNDLLHQIVALTGHPVDDIIGIWIDNEYYDISLNRSSNELDGSWFIEAGRLADEDIPAKLVKVLKNNGWGFADKTYVNDENNTVSAAGTRPGDDRSRIGEISTFINDDIGVRQSPWSSWPSNRARDTATGIWEYTGVDPDAKFHKVTNCSYVYTRFEHNTEAFSGWPNVKFHIKGRRLYNPALDSTLVEYGADSNGNHRIDDPDTWEYSNDWTLCVLDYLINTYYGLGVKADTAFPLDSTLNEIDWEEAISSYNISSATVSKNLEDYPSATEPRYTVDGVFETSATPISTMESLLTCAGGELIYSQGFYKIRPAHYRAPESESNIINEDMIVSSISIRSHTPRSELFNKVAGVYIRKLENENEAPHLRQDSNETTNKYLFEGADFPLVNPVDSSGINQYEIEDGEEIIKDFDYPFTLSSTMAQRLARIQLERARRGLAVSFEATLEILKYSVGDTVYFEILDDTRYEGEAFANPLGFDINQQLQDTPATTPYYRQFKITDMSYTENFTIAVAMVEESPDIYEWNDGFIQLDTNALISDLHIDSPIAPVGAPSYNTVTEVLLGTDIRTEITWNVPIRDSANPVLVDRLSIRSYILEYGIVDNPSEALPKNRVSKWITGGFYSPDDKTLDIQGPIGLNNLFIDDVTVYDFRIRSIANDGRRSVWVYFSEDTGSDYTPGIPYGAKRYYISAPDGIAIKNGVGTLNLLAYEITSAGASQLSSGTVQLRDASTNDLVGDTPNVGYQASFVADDINEIRTIVLKDDVSGPVLHSVTLIDIFDGQGRTVSLTADRLAFIYDATDTIQSPTSALFTATGYNFDSAEYYQFLVDGSVSNGQSWSTDNTFSYNAPTDFTSLPQVVTVQASNDDGTTVHAEDSVTVVGVRPGQNGSDSVTILLSNDTHSVPSDNDGSNPNLTGSGTTIDVYYGTTRLTGVNSTPGDGQYNVTVNSISPPGAVNTPSITHGQPTSVADFTSMTSNSVTIDYDIQVYLDSSSSPTFTKTQSLSKTPAGANSTVPGPEGDPGLRTIQGYLYMEKSTSPGTPPSAPSGTDEVYTFSTGLVSGDDVNTGASTTNAWENSPRTRDATSSNIHYTVRYYGQESTANSSTIGNLSWSNVVKDTEFSGVVRFINGTEIANSSTTYDPAADVNIKSTTIDGGKISTGSITANQINSEFYTGRTFQTRALGGTPTEPRVAMGTDGFSVQDLDDINTFYVDPDDGHIEVSGTSVIDNISAVSISNSWSQAAIDAIQGRLGIASVTPSSGGTFTDASLPISISGTTYATGDTPDSGVLTHAQGADITLSCKIEDGNDYQGPTNQNYSAPSYNVQFQYETTTPGVWANIGTAITLTGTASNLPEGGEYICNFNISKTASTTSSSLSAGDYTIRAQVTYNSGSSNNPRITQFAYSEPIVGSGASGTVTSVSVESANGFAGTVATATTTPAITLSTSINSPILSGNGTAIAAATTTGTGSTAVLNNAPTFVGEVTAGTFNATSDLYEKEEVKTYVPSDIDQLRTVSYKFKGCDKTRVGYIAQEVQEVMPDVVMRNTETESLVLDYNSVLAAKVARLEAQVLTLLKKLEE